MNSGTPEVPDQFNLEEDPFPQLATRDVLIVASNYLTKKFHGMERTTLEEELTKVPALEQQQSGALASFLLMTGGKYLNYLGVPSSHRYGYVEYWNELGTICHSHLLQSRYGFGSERPEPSSPEESAIQLLQFQDDLSEILSPQKRELLGKGPQLIDNGNFFSLLRLTHESCLARQQRLGMSTESGHFSSGLYSAYADARLLLTMLEYPSSPGEESL